MTAVQDRFTERVTAGRRRRRRVVLAALAVVVLVAAGWWAVWFSSVFDTRSVVVNGQTSLSHEEIVRVAAVPMGGPLVRVDTAAIAKRVSTLKPVASVEVSRRWPHSVVVAVHERTAVGWVQQGAERWAVDAGGVMFRVLDRPAGMRLEVESTDGDSVQSAAAVAADIAARNPRLAGAVRSISAESADSVTLNLTGDRTVVWGSVDRGADKVRVLKALLRIKARQYDVSAPDNPTTRQDIP